MPTRVLLLLGLVVIATATNRTSCFDYVDCFERSQLAFKECAGGTGFSLALESKDRSVAELLKERPEVFASCQEHLAQEIIDFDTLQVLVHEDSRECFDKLPVSTRPLPYAADSCVYNKQPERDNTGKENFQCVIEYLNDRHKCEQLLDCCPDHVRCGERMNAVSTAYQHARAKGLQIVTNLLTCVVSKDPSTTDLIHRLQRQRNSLRNAGLPFFRPDQDTEERISRRLALTSSVAIDERKERFQARYQQVRALLAQIVDQETQTTTTTQSPIASERRVAIVRNLLRNADEQELTTYVSLIADGNFEKLSELEREKVIKLENEEQVKEAMHKMKKIRDAIKSALAKKEHKTTDVTVPLLEKSTEEWDEESSDISSVLNKAMSQIDDETLHKAKKFATAVGEALEAQKELLLAEEDFNNQETVGRTASIMHRNGRMVVTNIQRVRRGDEDETVADAPEGIKSFTAAPPVEPPTAAPVESKVEGSVEKVDNKSEETKPVEEVTTGYEPEATPTPVETTTEEDLEGSGSGEEPSFVTEATTHKKSHKKHRKHHRNHKKVIDEESEAVIIQPEPLPVAEEASVDEVLEHSDKNKEAVVVEKKEEKLPEKRNFKEVVYDTAKDKETKEEEKMSALQEKLLQLESFGQEKSKAEGMSGEDQVKTVPEDNGLLNKMIDNLKESLDTTTPSGEVHVQDIVEGSGESDAVLEEPLTSSTTTTGAPVAEETNFCARFARCDERVRDYEDQCHRKYSEDILSHGIDDAEILSILQNSTISHNDIVLKACLRPLDKNSHSSLKQLLIIERGVRKACLDLGRNKPTLSEQETAFCRLPFSSPEPLDEFLFTAHGRSEENRLTCLAKLEPFRDYCQSARNCCASANACDKYLLKSPVYKMKEEAIEVLVKRQAQCEERMVETLRYIHEQLTTRRRLRRLMRH